MVGKKTSILWGSRDGGGTRVGGYGVSGVVGDQGWVGKGCKGGGAQGWVDVWW